MEALDWFVNHSLVDEVVRSEVSCSCSSLTGTM